MMLSYAVEQWPDAAAEIMALWPAHNAEVAATDDRDHLAPDLDRYMALHAAGKLHVVVARKDGAVIGYLFACVETHLHRRNTLCGFYDIYFVAPEHRKGWAGVHLFKVAERTLRARGVVKLHTGTKLWKDVGVLFERMGWKETERLFTKNIGN
jgi:GNAT superfamily N-acetyltransferase